MWDGACAGGAAKQSSIFHASLLRVLEPAQLPQEALAAIHAACRQQSERLRGLRFTPDAMWYAASSSQQFLNLSWLSPFLCVRLAAFTPYTYTARSARIHA